MAVTNVNGLQALMEKKMEAVLIEVSEKVYNNLIRLIKSHIYIGKTSNWYKRTGDFMNAFQLTDLKKSTNELTRELFYNWKTMTPPGSGDNQGYTHGSVEDNIDRRKDLWWILDDWRANTMNSEFGGALGVDDTSGYLEEFNMVLKRDFWKWVNTACKKNGIERVK